MHFKKSNGELIDTVEGNEGDDLVDLSQEYDLDIEAACEKSLACSTCHIILEPEMYDQLEEPSDEENDMLGGFSCTLQIDAVLMGVWLKISLSA